MKHFWRKAWKTRVERIAKNKLLHFPMVHYEYKYHYIGVILIFSFKFFYISHYCLNYKTVIYKNHFLFLYQHIFIYFSYFLQSTINICIKNINQLSLFKNKIVKTIITRNKFNTIINFLNFGDFVKIVYIYGRRCKKLLNWNRTLCMYWQRAKMIGLVKY